MSVKAVIPFFYLHIRARSASLVEENQSEICMDRLMDWTYTWNRREYMIQHSTKPASTNMCIPISTLSAEVIIRTANQNTP